MERAPREDRGALDIKKRRGGPSGPPRRRVPAFPYSRVPALTRSRIRSHGSKFKYGSSEGEGQDIQDPQNGRA